MDDQLAREANKYLTGHGPQSAQEQYEDDPIAYREAWIYFAPNHRDVLEAIQELDPDIIKDRTYWPAMQSSWMLAAGCLSSRLRMLDQERTTDPFKDLIDAMGWDMPFLD